MKKILSTVLIIIFLATPLWAETPDLEPQGVVQQLLREIRQIKPESSVDNQKYSQSALSLLNVSEIKSVSSSIISDTFNNCVFLNPFKA